MTQKNRIQSFKKRKTHKIKKKIKKLRRIKGGSKRKRTPTNWFKPDSPKPRKSKVHNTFQTKKSKVSSNWAKIIWARNNLLTRPRLSEDNKKKILDHLKVIQDTNKKANFETIINREVHLANNALHTSTTKAQVVNYIIGQIKKIPGLHPRVYDKAFAHPTTLVDLINIYFHGSRPGEFVINHETSRGWDEDLEENIDTPLTQEEEKIVDLSLEDYIVAQILTELSTANLPTKADIDAANSLMKLSLVSPTAYHRASKSKSSKSKSSKSKSSKSSSLGISVIIDDKETDYAQKFIDKTIRALYRFCRTKKISVLDCKREIDDFIACLKTGEIFPICNKATRNKMVELMGI